MSADPILATFYGDDGEDDSVDPVLATFYERTTPRAATGPAYRPGSVSRFTSAANPIPDLIDVAGAVVSDPVGVVRGLVDTREQFGEAANEWRDVTEGRGGVMEAIAASSQATPVLGPILRGLSDEVGAPLAEGDYATAAGKVVKNLIPGAALKAVRPVVKAVGAVGQQVAKGTAGRYGSAVSEAAGMAAPLSENLASKMMAAGSKGTRETVAPALDEAVAAIKAERAALPQPTRGPGGKMIQSQSVQAQRAQMTDDLAMADVLRRNMDKLEKATSGSRSIGHAVYEGAKNVAGLTVAGWMLKAVPLVEAGALTLAGGYAITRTAARVAKLPQFKMLTPAVQRAFGEAMQSNNVATVAKIAAGVAAGTLLPDEYGHRDAVGALTEEAAPLPTTELKRQVVMQKRAVYVSPDGTETPVPQQVMTQFANAQNVTETASPVSAWLEAMAKQGKVKRGGKLEFR